MKQFGMLLAPVIATVALAASANASSVTQQSGGALTPHVIPFKLKDNVIKLQATVDGKKVTAVLDSGSGGVIVSKALAAKLGLQLHVNPSIQAGGGGTKKQTIFPIKLHDVQFGPLDLHNVSGYAINMHPLSESSGFKIDALLGYPFFQNHAIRINYPKRTVTIYPTGKTPTCANPIPIKIIYHVPVVTTKIVARTGAKAQTYQLIVDLGSRHYSYLGAAFLKTKTGKALFTRGHPKQVGVGTGGVMKGVAAKLAQLYIGNQHFHDVNFALTRSAKVFNSQKLNGSLGVPLWKDGIITFNYPDKTLCIDTPHE
ncbi:MAG: retropepsin-like aspartic protease [Gammaproteobacteria bacterium]